VTAKKTATRVKNGTRNRPKMPVSSPRAPETSMDAWFQMTPTDARKRAASIAGK
jgi:hypothetical protein